EPAGPSSPSPATGPPEATTSTTSPSPPSARPLPRIIITGSERIAETKTIADVYHAYPPDAAWATPEQVWGALLRTNRKLTHQRVNALPRDPLRYWTVELLRRQSDQAVEDTITYMDTKVQSDVSQFVHTWMDHLRHIIRVDRGEEDSTPSPSESDQDDAAR